MPITGLQDMLVTGNKEVMGAVPLLGTEQYTQPIKVSFQVLTDARMKMALFWVVAPYSLVEVC
jgi:hypothetical protein